jgi:hypothetical protein
MKKTVFVIFALSALITMVLWMFGGIEHFYRFNLFLFEQAYSLILSFFNDGGNLN